jgi:tRNA threonylcarbamoyladenosine biosynthesis protein TsaB
MYFLLIETSHSLGSISLFSEEKYLQELFLEGKFMHAEQLAVGVQKILQSFHLSAKDISGVGISDGPGSYTGLRIGASWAKGFCLPYSTPLISCSETKALKVATQSTESVLCLIDARRMEAFGEWFDGKTTGSSGTQAWIFEENLVKEWMAQNPVLAGDAVEKLKVHFPYSWKDSGIRFSHSKHLFPEFFQKWKSQNFENLFTYEPNYVKPVYLLPSKN